MIYLGFKGAFYGFQVFIYFYLNPKNNIKIFMTLILTRARVILDWSQTTFWNLIGPSLLINSHASQIKILICMQHEHTIYHVYQFYTLFLPCKFTYKYQKQQVSELKTRKQI
jgi:hypothetical protein